MTATLTLTAPGQRSYETSREPGLNYQTTSLPARLDVHCLEELQYLCQHNIASDLVIDAGEVRFLDTAGLLFLENLDTVRRTAGSSVQYLRPSPALVATFELHGSKLADRKVMSR